jgi:hypothetical protein
MLHPQSAKSAYMQSEYGVDSSSSDCGCNRLTTSVSNAVDSFTTWVGDVYDGLVYAKPPANAYDPDGPKAPGRPTEADGFRPPKGGDDWVANPNPGKGGGGFGWQDAAGDVWVPSGHGARAHGGPHWDVQTPGGGYRNVRP